MTTLRAPTPAPAVDDGARALEAARRRTLSLLATVGERDVDRVHDPLMSPVAWDLGHVAAYEDLWVCHRAGGLPLLHPGLTEVYDAFETPRARRGDAPYLRRDDALAYQAKVRRRALVALAAAPDPFYASLAAEHEGQHCETMLQALQLAPAGTYRPPAWLRAPGPVPAGGAPEIVGAGTAHLGAESMGFAYDNERPRHAVEFAAYAIDAYPVTCGAWAAWMRAGGYARREWWSDAGWAWREAEGAQRPLYW